MKNLFPILSDITYLDTASSCILSEPLFDWRRSHDRDFFEKGSVFRTDQAAFLSGVKKSVADFFNSKINNTFLVPNFSFAFNTLLSGLSPKNRFLILAEEYPSVSFPIKNSGFEFKELAIDEHLEENIFRAISEYKPTVLAFSIVQYINGMKIEKSLIKKVKESFPELLLVADGTQYCGTEVFDFENSGLDVLAASGYKWMLAGYGNGFILLSDRIGNQLYADSDFSSVPFEFTSRGKNNLSLLFEPGHLDTLNFGSLQQSVLFLQKLGMDHIESQIHTLAHKAKEAFSERGLLEDVIVKSKSHSSIFNIKGDDVLFQKMQSENIVCIQRGKGIRVGFHFFNTEDDLERLLDQI